MCYLTPHQFHLVLFSCPDRKARQTAIGLLHYSTSIRRFAGLAAADRWIGLSKNLNQNDLFILVSQRYRYTTCPAPPESRQGKKFVPSANHYILCMMIVMPAAA